MTTPRPPTWSIGIDVGGTYTDLYAIASDRTFIEKTPSTPEDQSKGVMNGLRRLAAREGADLRQFLGQCDYVVHGTTVATNIMLEFNGAPTGMLTTSGHRDTIELRRNFKESAFDLTLGPPTTIVKRRHRLPIAERVDSSGAVRVPLDPDDVRRQVQALVDAGIKSIAVCYLFSPINPTHELMTREIAHEVDPSVHVSLSYEVLPRVREYERFSTTVVDAYVTPAVRDYLLNLKAKLRDNGFAGEIFIMGANGGMMEIDKAGRHGVQLTLSGPAGGVVAGSAMGEEAGIGDLITIDMGGTSFDACLIKDLQPTVGDDGWISRYRIAVPTLDINTIGAGGGSIASIDAGGALLVGPESAGAQPGPACYGRGGTRPTVTDADLCMGLIGSGSFLGGEMPLDVKAARRAVIEHVAEPSGLTYEEALLGIFKIVNNNMVNGVREISITQGYDPRDFALVAFGGAGAIHAGKIAQSLGIPKILVARARASILAAVGEVMSDVRLTRSESMFALTSEVELDWLSERVRDVVGKVRAEIEGVESVSSILTTVAFSMRYRGQTHEITVPTEFSGDGRITEDQLNAVVGLFHGKHERLYTFSKPGNPTEMLGFEVDARGVRPKPEIPSPAGDSVDGSVAPISYRAVLFEEYGHFKDGIAVYSGLNLPVAVEVEGPAIVEEPHTTVVLSPGMRLRVASGFRYEIEVDLQ